MKQLDSPNNQTQGREAFSRKAPSRNAELLDDSTSLKYVQSYHIDATNQSIKISRFDGAWEVLLLQRSGWQEAQAAQSFNSETG